MISAFQYWEFGLGYPLTVPDIQTINEYQYIHTKYFDTESATNILVHTNK